MPLSTFCATQIGGTKSDGELDTTYKSEAQLQPMLKKVLIGIGILVVALAAFALVELYHYPKAQVAAATYQNAPDFTLQDGQGQPFTLASQRGHKVVLFFYRGYW
jgi:cytochrome oxidase Cu insertion factor (SCO1/SenC/PrrC family)